MSGVLYGTILLFFPVSLLMYSTSSMHTHTHIQREGENVDNPPAIIFVFIMGQSDVKYGKAFGSSAIARFMWLPISFLFVLFFPFFLQGEGVSRVLLHLLPQRI